MLKAADIVVITKGDIVSQAEREVFLSRVNSVNPKAITMHINGLTGQGGHLNLVLYYMMKARYRYGTRESLKISYALRPMFLLFRGGDTYRRRLSDGQCKEDKTR